MPLQPLCAQEMVSHMEIYAYSFMQEEGQAG
jgi:hypothetical protein